MISRVVLLTVAAALAAAILHALVLVHSTINTVTEVIEQDGVEETGACIRQEVQEHFGGAIFDSLRQSERRDEVARRLLGLMRRHGGFRIKVYDESGVILWSDETRLIGRRFPDNFLLDRALAGEVASKFERPERSEHEYERGAAAYIAEIYVPIPDPSGRVQGVVEMYRRADDVAAGLSRVKRTVWTGAAVATGFLCAALALIVGYGQRRVLRLNEQLREHRDALMGEKAKLDAVVDGVGVGLLLVGQDRRVLWANRAMEMGLGRKGDPVGKLCHDVLWGNDAPCADCSSRRALATGSESHADKSFRGKDGRTRHYHVVAWPMRDASGKASHTLEMVQDVTESVQMQVRFQQAAKLATAGELAGHVAHEVNNPIAIISGKLRLLLANHRDDLPAKVAEDLAKCVDLADRIALIAQGLLSFCRPSASGRAPLDLRAPARKAWAVVEGRARAAGVVLDDQMEGDTLPFVSASAAELEQVFLNLLLNALDAMPGGGRITLSASTHSAGLVPREPRVLVSVEDTGPGMTPEVRERIFDPFFTTKGEWKGTGLGLSICLGIVQGHGGTIEVESEPGRGTRFTVCLPGVVAGDF